MSSPYGIADWPCQVTHDSARFTEEAQFLLHGRDWPASLADCTRHQASCLLKDMQLLAGSNVDTRELLPEQLTRFKQLLAARLATPPMKM